MKILKVGQIYTLRNGLKTSPLRVANNGTSYKFEADVKEPEHETKSVISWKVNGRTLLDYVDHKHDIIFNVTETKLEFLKLNYVNHSGQGKDATHLKVMREFEKSKDNGIKYCEQRGWKVFFNDGILQVKSDAMFGFQMNAIVKEV